MKNHISRAILFIVMGLLFTGCATQKKTAPKFTAVDLNPTLQDGAYVQKVDNFVVILDKSGSMKDLYNGHKKLDYAKCTVSRMNQTIPNLNMTGSLRAFGRFSIFCKQFTQNLWGPASYIKSDLEAGLEKVGFSVGESPLNQALDAAGKDLASAQGNIALIIFTDADKETMNYEAVRKSAMGLKSRYGSRLCIYTVQIGDDPEGKKLLQQVAEEGKCGFYTKADQISSNQDMADFVQKVFLKKAPPKPEVVEEVVEKKVVILDSDGDGVPDNLDKCPNTPKGAKVNTFGCWVLEDVLFDFDKYNIKSQYHQFLDEAAAVFQKNPSLKVVVEGHTDNIGPAAYNMRLSLKRAHSVMNYLISKGIAKDRLSAKGYGFTRPISTNTTRSGRALNRRVELTPVP